MSAASPESTEASGRAPSGRHRREGSSALAALVVGVLLIVLVAAAMFSPVLLGWPPPTEPEAAPSSTVDPTRTTSAATPSPTATPRPTRTTRPPSTVDPLAARPIASFENEVLALTNAQRREEGCPELRLDTRLRTAARRHSAEMAYFGYLSHTSRDGSGPAQRIRKAGYTNGGGWAENIARGYPTPSAVMAGWLNSPGHRANILNCSLRALGVGVVRSDGGRVYWTQDFGGR